MPRQINTLDAISPIDGRYRKYTEDLAAMFSERALIKHRIIVEGEYLIALSEHPGIGPRKFSTEEKKLIRDLYDLSLEDAQMVKDIEEKGYRDIPPTEQDVKAVEYYMRASLIDTSLSDSLEWIHFALTSEDPNNIAYGLMLRDGLEKVLLPAAVNLRANIEELALKYKNIPMLARTHGKPASPTTVGKMFKTFAHRIAGQTSQFKERGIFVKLNGATGNWNAHYATYPEVDWPRFTEKFIERFNKPGYIQLKPNFVTTQIEPHDTYAELSNNLRLLNTIVIDFDRDMWRYISDGWIGLKSKKGEVHSSTMPHKISPKGFENSEGNLGMANTMLYFFSAELPISRLQRHLSDSTIIRNFGVAFAHSLIGYKSALRDLKKIKVDEHEIIAALNAHPEVVSEAIQTILRKEGIVGAYEKLKELTQGKKVTMEDIEAFIDKLDVSDELKERLKAIEPTNYTGIAALIVENY